MYGSSIIRSKRKGGWAEESALLPRSVLVEEVVAIVVVVVRASMCEREGHQVKNERVIKYHVNRIK